MSAWIFLLLAWLAGFAAQSQQTAPAERVACPTCAGTGVANQPCLRCNGSKTYPCVVCNSLAHLTARVETLEALSQLVPADEKLAEGAAQLRIDLERLKAKEKSSGSPPPKGTTICWSCSGAKPEAGQPRCKICSGKGHVDCTYCEGKGRRPCTECQRKGIQSRPCETCNGTKQISRPSAEPSDAVCPWSGGDAWRPCVHCDSEGTRVAPCLGCNGEKTSKCLMCFGSRRANCSTCLGTGMPLSSALTNKPADCKDCKGKGTVPCQTCKSTGKIPCIVCAGTGSANSACERCFGPKKALCLGCSSLSARAWEEAAERSTSAGAREEALAYWKIVESRTERRFATLLEKALSDGARKDLEKARTAELARVRKRIEALKG